MKRGEKDKERQGTIREGERGRMESVERERGEIEVGNANKEK